MDARKCKHCGEFLDGSTAAPEVTTVPATPVAREIQPVWRFGGFMWRCIEHGLAQCRSCRNLCDPPTRTGRKGEVFPSKEYTGKKSERQKLSKVGDTESGTLACPKCGGTQFTAKRSSKGKMIGFATLGVGGLLAPKSEVKCVTCGTMFRRG